MARDHIPRGKAREAVKLKLPRALYKRIEAEAIRRDSALNGVTLALIRAGLNEAWAVARPFNDARISLFMEATLYDEIKLRARTFGVSQQELMRQAIVLALEKVDIF